LVGLPCGSDVKNQGHIGVGSAKVPDFVGGFHAVADNFTVAIRLGQFIFTPYVNLKTKDFIALFGVFDNEAIMGEKIVDSFHDVFLSAG
jgi:hypothetical protein